MSLIKNTIWNLSGYIIPSLIAIPALGFLARNLGPERFGLFTLAVAVIGYASIFDAGLTRAVVREISIFKNEKNETNKIVANASAILMILGLLGGGVIYLLNERIVLVLNVDKKYILETLKAISLISLSLPLFLLNQVWLAILEGREEFKKVNIVKSFNSSFIAGMPAIFVLYHSSLTYAVMGLVIARLFSVLTTCYVCRNDILSSGFKIDIKTATRLMKYGGWITVSNIISPMMAYFDRFIVAHVMGASHVAYYTAPAEGVQKLTIIPSALSRAIFPKLCGMYVKEEKLKQERLAILLMILAILPLSVLGIFFSTQIMTMWMGVAYTGMPARILEVLLVGFLFNAIAQIPFSSIQASGLSKVTALIHLYELMPYLLLLYLFIKSFGVMGAAYAWTIRVAIDCIILIIVNSKIKSR